MRGSVMMEKVLVAVTAVVLSVGYARAAEFSARLTGFEELGAQNNESGAILSKGSGRLEVRLDRRAGKIDYTLTYSDVGTTPPLTGTVTQAHIHFGKQRVAGGIMAFLCTNLGNGPAGVPACPTNGGTVSGTITAADIIAIPKQNVNAGDFDALEDALASGTAYGNVHTTALPAGEIRGQLRGGDDDDRGERRERR